MKEYEENSSDGSAISENAEFSKLNLNNNNNSDNENNNSDNEENHKDKLKNKNIINDIEDDVNKSYNSMFSFAIVPNNVDHNKFGKEIKNDNKNLKESNLDIRSSDSSSTKISIWETIKQQISNFKNQIIFNYNIFTGLNNLKLNAPGLPKEMQIFDEIYSKQDEKLINRLKNIPWFSYRKDFEQIKDKDKIYTSDAGWGCMIRASQMILAQGLYQLFSIKDLDTFINEYIAYFYDNKIPMKLLSKSKDDINFDPNNIKEKNNNKDNDDEIYDDFLIIDPSKESRMSFIDISMEMIKGLENMSDRNSKNSNKKFLTSPFSIRNFIKYSVNGKKVGQFFSNYDVIKLITEINLKLNENNDTDFKIINFADGAIYIEDIINTCFKEEEKKSNDIYGFENISYSTFQKSEILFDENNINNDLKSDIYIFNKRRFQFNHKFIIFVSVRHGLYKLEEEVYEDIFKIFDIKTNIGLIGGKNTRAFYFIGRCDKNLIFLDPHYVQPTIPLNKFGTDSIQETYRPNDIYYMPINDLSPSFSIGFAVKDMKNFKILMDKLNSPDYFIKQKNKKTISSKKTNLFVVKNWHFPVLDDDDSNQDISNHIELKENFF